MKVPSLVLMAGFVLVLITSAMPGTSHAQSIPTGGAPLLATQNDGGLKLIGDQATLAKVEEIAVDGQHFNKALRVRVEVGAKAAWSVQLAVPLTGDVKKEDVILAHFWVRCVESMTGDAQIGVVVEQSQPPHEKIIDRHIAAGAKWTQCFVPVRASRDLSGAGAQLCLRLGFDRQTLEIADLQLLNFASSVKLESLPITRMSYPGSEPDAAWRKQAFERIDKIRKGDLTISVVDANGKPVTGAKVQLQLKRHQFGFGSCVTAELLTADSDDARKYREIVEKYFNLAVFENDMKWPALWDGIPQRVDQALDWLLAKNIKVRGHNLVWPSWKWSPSGLRQYEKSPDELSKKIAAHITDVTKHFARKLFEWDVVNEPFSNRELIDPLGGDKVMIEWFKLAHAADPDSKLFINDYGVLEGGKTNAHREHFYNTIKFLKDNGAPLHGIGIQSHFSSDLPSPMQVMSVFDRFGEFGLPIVSTELSLNIDDPQVQASYLRDYMIAAFSHPKMEGIMLWGFWEKRHWRPMGALFAADWSIRPVGKAFVDLMENEFTTRAELTTDAQGKVTTRGYLGSYDLTINSNGTATTTTVELPTSKGVEIKLSVR